MVSALYRSTFRIISGRDVVVKNKRKCFVSCLIVQIFEGLPEQTDLLLALLMEQLPQVVQAAGDGALVGVGVLQVLIRNVCTGQKGAFGLVQVALVHQDDSCVQVGRCKDEGGINEAA